MHDGLGHVPVLHTTVLALLEPKRGETVLDVTLGLGGHAFSFLEATGPDGKLIALDADAENLALAKERLKPFESRTTFHHVNFHQLGSLDLPPVDILFADLGLSSPHLDDASRGFTFRADAPLDMRFDRSSGQTAAELIRTTEEEDLALLLWKYGDIHESRTIASAILAAPPSTTGELKAVIEKAVGYRAKEFLPRVFQALRIAVNDEEAALEHLIAHGPLLLKPGGRMAVISYHSLEDRLTKHAFRALCDSPKDPVTGKRTTVAPFELVTRKAVVPDSQEILDNPRSRSAKLRILLRLPS